MMRYLRRIAVLTIILASLLIATLPARGADATVAVCDFASLSAAVATANAGGGTVDFTCSGTINFTSQLDITATVTINENGNTVIFDGGNTTRLFMVNTGASLSVNGFIFQNGNASTIGGGAINNDGAVNIANSTFNNNVATAGGAIINIGTLIITDSIFTNNVANLGNGGAIQNNGTILTVSNSQFTGNTSNNNAGAIRTTSGTVTLINNSFVSNDALGVKGISVGGGTATSQDTHYENNNCGGTLPITDNGGNTVINAAGCPGTPAIVLSASAVCVGDNLQVTISAGDGNFNITGTGAGLPANGVGLGTTTLTGPGSWTGVTVTELSGNDETLPLGDFNCPAPLALSASAVCVGDDLVVTIANGDAPFNITGVGAGLPANGVGLGATLLTGPGSWNSVIIAEVGGDNEIILLADFDCPEPIALSANAVCLGIELVVTISAGDPNFNITSSTLGNLGAFTVGTFTFPGPNNWETITITELSGDAESDIFTGLDCFISNTLTASVVCNGANLELIISNGNAPFTIDVNGVVTSANPVGIYSYMGPDTFIVSVTEETGDLEGVAFAPLACDMPIVPPAPPAPVVLSPDLTALGCVVTADVDIFNAPDNTYCRILMQNGGVVNYSGAIPAPLIGLGVKIAVDVYRLDGGRSITEFPNYTQICLAGQGRLFYMDSRNAPRVSIELATETLGGATCGWIPAPGTLILTN